jgi:hypothetical protein
MAAADHLIRSHFDIRFKMASSTLEIGADSGDSVAAPPEQSIATRRMAIFATASRSAPVPFSSTGGQVASPVEAVSVPRLRSVEALSTCGRQKEWRNTTTETARSVSISLLA